MTLEVAESAGCHLRVLHESKLLQDLSDGPVLRKDAM